MLFLTTHYYSFFLIFAEFLSNLHGLLFRNNWKNDGFIYDHSCFLKEGTKIKIYLHLYNNTK